MLDGHSLFANAQLPTFPPPLPDTGSGSTTGGSSVTTDNAPPKIEILTAELHEGKNVVTVRIIDDSDLRAKFVRYVSEGKIILSDLSRDEGNLYSALISVKGPSAVLVFEAIDLNGNRAKVAQDYTVKPLAATWLDSLLKWFTEFFSLAATWLDSLLKWFTDLLSSLGTYLEFSSTSSG
jgi:hypothetical protein